MMNIQLICVGKLKEEFYAAAAGEYIKRLGAFCRITVTELAEQKLPASPSPALINAALEREAAEISAKIPKGAVTVAMCIEGRELDSSELAAFIPARAVSGDSALCFLIGGSNGLAESVKSKAALRLSMSRMTFPHHLARIMLLEQLYRAFSIQNGGKYHK